MSGRRAQAASPPSGKAKRLRTFSRVLVGVDGSPESREAARQAAILTEVGGRLTLLAVYDLAPGIVGGTGTGTPASFDEDLQRESARDALEGTRRALTGLAEPIGKLTRGNASDELIREIVREQHTLLAFGSHGTGRIRGILVGSTATELIHKAACSVLVAREARADFPRRIVVGVDGSPQSATAPVEALAVSAADADLLVVGSRGLHGLKSLGSVSERVAHEAHYSVLTVREPPWQRVSEELGSQSAE